MITDELIYLACPYSEGESSVELMRQRSGKATYVTGKLIQRGYIVFSPLTHNEPINDIVKLPRTWDFWCRFDATFLLRCDKLMVLMLDGWETSTGVKDEIRLAKLHNIPIEYIKLEDF